MCPLLVLFRLSSIPVLRSRYERNKHIFPASRWEIFDPEKTFESYTIS